MHLVPLSSGPASAARRSHLAPARPILLAAVLLVVTLSLACCAQSKGQAEQQAYDTVQAYLHAQESGDLEGARAYWTDINNPGGTWTLVAGRDMDHVTRGHSVSFAGGVDIVASEFATVQGPDKQLGVLQMEVRVKPSDEIKKLEIGLVRHNERWYIYSIYPGTW